MIALYRPAAAVSTAATVHWHRHRASAASTVASVPLGSKPSVRQAHNTRCLAASTEQGRERHGGGSATGERWAGSTTGEAWSGGGSSGAGSADPLLRSIAQCSTAGELHQLLLRHSGELGGREVAAALQVTARRRLLESAAPTSASGPLAPLLVQLADKYAAVMEPASLSASAWGLAALQLLPARPVVRRMQELARRQLFRFAPSQLCALLWAGGSLEPGAPSPLLPALATLVRGGMSLALFSARDLAVLAYLCGRERGGAAKDVSLAVTEECRSRVQEYRRAERQARGGVAAPRKRGPKGRSRGGGGPLAPFTPADVAMLLTGLALQQLRVEGVVEPLVQQCEPQLEAASAGDVTRILVALGELMMEVETDLMVALFDRLSKGSEELSPQQVAATLWACLRVGVWNKQAGTKLGTMAVRHYARYADQYRAVDTIGVLWGAAQLQRKLPDETLAGALHAVQPELGQQSISGLTSLLGAVGKLVDLRRARSEIWLQAAPAGQAAVATAAAALAELAQRLSSMQPAELAAVAAALAASTQLVAALPAQATEHAAALRRACATAAAANDLTSVEVAQLATAAARLRWAERDFVDALAHAIECRVRLGFTTSQVFSQAVCALASLAPARHGDVFTALAAAYASRAQQLERAPNPFGGFQAEERTAVLTAFAAVAQARGLGADALHGILASFSPADLRSVPMADAVPLLVLAAEARFAPHSAVVQACCRTIERSFPRLDWDAQRQVHAALARMLPQQDPLVLSLERQLHTAFQMDAEKPAGKRGTRG